MTRAQSKMLAAIMRASPCHPRETIERWAKHWPKDVTLYWLLTHGKRGKEWVGAWDRCWLARALLPRKACARADGRILARDAARGWDAPGDLAADLRDYARECKPRRVRR